MYVVCVSHPEHPQPCLDVLGVKLCRLSYSELSIHSHQSLDAKKWTSEKRLLPSCFKS